MKNRTFFQNLEENDFDTTIWQKAQLKNNSGYLDEEYQMTPQFPTIPEYHFRIEDDSKILQFQKLSLNDQQNKILSFEQGSDKFKINFQSLIQGLDNVKIHQNPLNKVPVQRHGFYSFEGYEYDEEAAIKEAFNRLQVNEIEKKIQNLSINENKPKFIKKPKHLIKAQASNAAPNSNGTINNLSKQMKKLTIDQEQM